MIRWTFEDVETSDTYTMVRNPKEMTTPTRPHRTERTRGLGLRAGDAPTSWSFKGKVRTQEEYDALLDWAGRDVIRITDHLGRIHRVIPVSFDPVPRRTHFDADWRFDYTFNALYLGRDDA